MDMRLLVNPDPEERASGPLLLPQKRKALDLDSSRNSRDSTPRLNDASETPSRIPLTPSNHIIRHPTFIPTSEPGFFSTGDVPSSRNYRYLPAVLSPTYDPAIDEHPYYRTGESEPAGCVRVSWEDRSPFIRVSEDGLSLAGDKGFRSARLNVPVREGQWYFEVNILNGDGDLHPGTSSGAGSSHVRLGWGRREASLNGPAGLDGYSYGMRDKTGEKVHVSRPRAYGKPFRTGDVVGLYISLPPRRRADPKDTEDPARIVPKRAPLQYKGSSYFEASEYLRSKEMEALMDNPDALKALRGTTNTDDRPQTTKSSGGALVKNTPASAPGRKRPGDARPAAKPAGDPLRPLPVLSGSAIAFFVNGEDQGVAFEDIYCYLQLPRPKGKARGSRTTALKERENHFDDGTLGYYPFISLFGNAQVQINAGPHFAHAPPADYRPGSAETSFPAGWRPLCERYDEYLSELRAIDAEEEKELRAAKLASALELKLAEEKDRSKKIKAAERAAKSKKADARKDKEKKPAAASSPHEDAHSGVNSRTPSIPPPGDGVSPRPISPIPTIVLPDEQINVDQPPPPPPLSATAVMGSEFPYDYPSQSSLYHTYPEPYAQPRPSPLAQPPYVAGPASPSTRMPSNPQFFPPMPYTDLRYAHTSHPHMLPPPTSYTAPPYQQAPQRIFNPTPTSLLPPMPPTPAARPPPVPSSYQPYSLPPLPNYQNVHRPSSLSQSPPIAPPYPYNSYPDTDNLDNQGAQ